MTLFNRGGGAKTLDDLLKNLPEKKDSVLRFMSETLMGCMDKGTVVHSIVHKALYQFLTLADPKSREVNISICLCVLLIEESFVYILFLLFRM